MAIPYMTVKDPKAAIKLYEDAFDGSTTLVMDGPDGSIMHAEMSIGGQRLMLSGEWPGMAIAPEGRSPVNFMIYVDNADAALEKAVAAGMTAIGEIENMFWGDRIAKASDGHGYEWTIAQTIEKVSEEDVKHRAKEWMAAME